MKNRYLAPLFILAFVLRGTFFSALPVFGVTPDPVLVLVLLVPLYYGGKNVLLYAFFIGLIRDYCFGITVGVSAVLYFLLALAVLLLRKEIRSERLLPALLLTPGGGVLFRFAYWGILQLFGFSYSVRMVLRNLPALLAMEFILAILFHLIFGLHRNTFASERELFNEGEFNL